MKLAIYFLVGFLVSALSMEFRGMAPNGEAILNAFIFTAFLWLVENHFEKA